MRNFATVTPSSLIPQIIIVTMPMLSPSMEIGRIKKWLKQAGDEVNCYDPLFEVTTRELLKEESVAGEIDDQEMHLQVESQDEAFVAHLLIEDDGVSDVAVGEPIAIFVENESDIEEASRMTNRIVEHYRKGHDVRTLCWQAYLKR